jgi:hypothetical protein
LLGALAGYLATSREIATAWITPVLARPPLKIGVLNLDETDVMRGLAPSYVPFTGGKM